MEQKGASSSKRNRTNDDFNETDEASTSANAVVVPNIVQTAAILKLDIDCFEETFDFLPLVDLFSVGQTCKRLQQVSGYIFNQSYGGLTISFNSGKICLTRKNHSYVIPRYFVPYLRKLHVKNNEHLAHLCLIDPKRHQIRQMELFHIDLGGCALERFQRISPKLEHLMIIVSSIDGDFHDSILTIECIE